MHPYFLLKQKHGRPHGEIWDVPRAAAAGLTGGRHSGPKAALFTTTQRRLQVPPHDSHHGGHRERGAKHVVTASVGAGIPSAAGLGIHADLGPASPTVRRTRLLRPL